MRILVGNMSKETTEEQLRDSFEKFGKVTSVSIELDESTGKSNGFGLVEMPLDGDAHNAVTGMNIGALAGRTAGAKKEGKS